MVISNTKTDKRIIKEYYPEIERLSKNETDSIKFEAVWEENDREPYYVVNYHFNGNDADYLSAAMNVFSALLEYVNSDADNPLYKKRIEMLVSEDTEYNKGILILKNFGCDGEKDYCKCLSVSGTSERIRTIEGLKAAKDSLLYLNLMNVRKIDVSDLLELSKLKRIELKNCTYENGETALDNNDISLLQEQNAGVKIVIE